MNKNNKTEDEEEAKAHGCSCWKASFTVMYRAQCRPTVQGSLFTRHLSLLSHKYNFARHLSLLSHKYNFTRHLSLLSHKYNFTRHLSLLSHK